MSTDVLEAVEPDAAAHYDADPSAPLVELNAPASTAALARLAERLRELHMSEPAAAAVARAVSDPAAVRRRIGATPSGSSPGILSLRVPGGRLLALNADVNALAVAAWPVNPRQASRLRYPVETAPGSTEATRFTPLTDIVGSPTQDELLLRVESEQHAIWAYDRLVEYLKELNDLEPRIAREGVISPIILAPATVRASDDETDDVTILMAVDGSSRVSAAQRVLGVSGSDVLYRFPRDRRALNDATARVRQVYGRNEVEVSEAEVARARVLNIPAFVVVAFESDDDADVDFASAVRSYIGLTHVDPPKPWDDAGRYDTYGAAVLDELHAAGKILDETHAYYAGTIPADELKQHGFSPYLDTRAAHLVHLVTRPTNAVYEITGRAIRRVSQKSRARQELRMAVFCELILRAMRTRALGGASVSGVRTALQRTYNLPDLTTDEWEVSSKAPDLLLDEALTELESGKPGPHARELAVRGSYWLVGYGILGRDVRGGQDGIRETRRPSTVLSVLMRSPHGLRILHRAMLDGRSGEMPRMIDPSGLVLRDATGTHEARMSTDWLRRVFPPDVEDFADAPSADETPTAALERARRRFVRAVDACGAAMRDLAGIEGPTGTPLIEEEGISPAEVFALRDKLRAIEDQLIVYSSIHRRAYPPVDSAP